MHSDLLLVLVVGTALAFDFTNGFHDTANVVATSISTRALSPRVAIGLAAVLNFAGAFISLKVAATIAKGIVDVGTISMTRRARIRHSHSRYPATSHTMRPTGLPMCATSTST